MILASSLLDLKSWLVQLRCVQVELQMLRWLIIISESFKTFFFFVSQIIKIQSNRTELHSIPQGDSELPHGANLPSKKTDAHPQRI